MRKAKFVKPLLIGCACCIPVGLVVGLSVNWDHRQFISSVGSSGVKPFVEAFGKKFIAANPKIDVQVEAGGTVFAVEEVAKGLTNVGNASNNPYYTINPIKGTGYKDKWVNKKTFTLGYEGLVILYKMPDGLSDEAKQNFDIVITNENILKLYAVFSGFNELADEEWKDEYGSIYYFMTEEAKNHLVTQSDIDICKKTQIVPFVRSGGNTAANSSIAFTFYSNLADFYDMTESQQNAFRGGQYGDDRLHYETEESNARAWELFNSIAKPGSMVYLTTGFVKNEANQEAIKKLGYRLVGYKDINYSQAIYLEHKGDLEKICVENGYNWYRPINCMIDLDNELSTKFIKSIYDNESYSDIMLRNGAKPLSDKQKDSMKVNGDMFSKAASDIELAKLRAETGIPIIDTIYGARELWWEE